MARNPLITKMRAKKFRRRRGNFQPLSTPAMNAGVAINKDLKKFWSQNIYTPSGPGKAHLAKEDRGFVDYRSHAKTIGQEEELPMTSARVAFLHAIIGPDVKLISDQRKKVVEHINRLRENEEEYVVGVVVERTKFRKLFLFRNGGHTCYFFVEHIGLNVRSSITYGSFNRADAVRRTNSIKWKPLVVTLPSPVPPSS